MVERSKPQPGKKKGGCCPGGGQDPTPPPIPKQEADSNSAKIIIMGN